MKLNGNTSFAPNVVVDTSPGRRYTSPAANGEIPLATSEFPLRLRHYRPYEIGFAGFGNGSLQPPMLVVPGRTNSPTASGGMADRQMWRKARSPRFRFPAWQYFVISAGPVWMQYRRWRTSRGSLSSQYCRLQVGNKLLSIFQPNVEADQTPIVVTLLAGEWWVGHDEAGRTAPTITDFEQ